ncbi:transposase [Dactylosporangium sp. CA-152071]|uniref:transposase n=1 Tax=Dactylosporangium sp. CA-152071 TaxID=3239933 RepID=UPI003D8F75AF
MQELVGGDERAVASGDTEPWLGLASWPEWEQVRPWLQLALTSIDLLAWTQVLLLDGELAAAEPKKLRYRLLHVAARLTRTARQTRLRIAETWPWATDLTTAFTRLNGLPRPIG